MTRILAIADEVDDALKEARLKELNPDLILACGDLPFDYLEYIRGASEVPLLYVHGNHDPAPVGVNVSAYLPNQYDKKPVQQAIGCISVEDRWEDETGLRIAGLGGSIRYNNGENQYTQDEMGRRARKLTRRMRRRRWRDGKSVDVFIAHSPPLDCGDAADPAHVGFSSFHRLIQQMTPRLMLHGHIHSYGRDQPDRVIGTTRVINVIPYRLLEIDP